MSPGGVAFGARAPRPSLRLDRIRVAYGGRVAVYDASLLAPVGRITGLIGPNGAGKTSILNTCNGIVKPVRGSIHLFDEDITHANPAARARLGLGRTFQTVVLCTAMSVRANVALGAESRLAGSSPRRQLAASVHRRQLVAAATEGAMLTCGIGELAGVSAAALSAGQRRLVELARVLAGGYGLLLLDEPSSGLDEHETRHLGRVLQTVAGGGDRGVLLVEHDMDLVMSVCDHIYVLDFGEMIFEGSPAEAQASATVRAAYLGTDDGAPPGSSR